METINTNSLKDKNRADYERSANRQDHGTRGTVRDKDPWGEYEWDMRGFKNVDKRMRTDDVDDGLDEYYAGMTPEELALEISEASSDIESELLEAEYLQEYAEELVTLEKADTMAELMNSKVEPEELSIRSLRSKKKYREQQAGREMGDSDD